VAVLAVLLLVLHLPLPLAVALAAGIYLGLALLRLPSPTWPGAAWRSLPWETWGNQEDGDIRDARPEEQTYAAAFAHAQSIRALVPRIAKPPVRDQIGFILDRVDQILTAMGDDQDLSQAPVLDAYLLEPLLDLLSTYLRLAGRGVQSGGEALERIESHDLPLILKAVDDFYERLHSRQLIDLAAKSDVIAFNLESVRAMMRRRATP